ncbi:hypothetical protein DFQ28_010394 [Apophysomyces sp. BC1034]|nr:hypothetical protein DFQ30_001932 [Apophysomyces sp. BC1015]KAG0192009.1 hypothetical protein DFQ28_010394 [Apophysomyces sp. BC1034]
MPMRDRACVVVFLWPSYHAARRRRSIPDGGTLYQKAVCGYRKRDVEFELAVAQLSVDVSPKETGRLRRFSRKAPLA